MSLRSAGTAVTRLALSFALATVSARPAHADDARDRAARAYEDAKKAFDGGAYQAAAVAFERVFREVPNGASMLAAGRAWEKAGEPALAADDFRTALAVGDLAPVDVAKAKERLDALEAELGRVEVLGPDGTTVSLGHAEAVRTPANVHARPGSVTVTATLVDGTKRTRVVVVEPGSVASVDYGLPRAPLGQPVPEVAVTRDRPTANPVRTAAWVSAGGALVAGIAAAVLAPVFSAKNSAWSSSPRTDAGQRDTVVSLQIGTDAAFLSACGLAALSATLFIASIRPSTTTRAATPQAPAPRVSIGPGWVGVVGQF